MPKQPIILTDEIVPPPALIRAGLDALQEHQSFCGSAEMIDHKLPSS